MAMDANAHSSLKYLDMQAAVGITKHNGGFEATDELLWLCHIESAREVLNVGCGIGVGSVYVARKHGCHVVGVDISEQMVAWSRQRAREERVEDRVTFQVADVLELPFEAGRFDVVFCESVLAFVDDRARAIGECVRVTKPGGYVGLNEAFWLTPPTPETLAAARDLLSADIPTLESWQALWEASSLREREVRTYPIDARAEIRSRLEWVGWRWVLRAWGRLARMALTDRAARRSIRQQFGAGMSAFEDVGYGLFVGRK